MGKDSHRTTVDSGRRAFVQTAFLCGGIATLVGIPATGFIISPALNKLVGKWVDFGSVKAFTPDTIEMLTYDFMVKDGWQVLPQRGFVWAKTDPQGKIVIFSSTCTHLACNVIWDASENVFQCPCHSGRFDPNGRPIAGPPTRPLDVLEHKIEDDTLKVFLAF